MVKVLYSKRNRVVKVGRIVCKTVKNNSLAKEEMLRLELLHKRGVAVPKTYGIIKNNIILKYVESTPLPDWLANEKLTRQDIERVAKQLANWLSSFYIGVNQAKTGIILEDVNCRNFLVCPDGKLCKVDFESFAYGCQEENIGEITAFIISYDLSSENKKIFAQCFLSYSLDKLNLDTELVLEKVKLADKKLKERRKNL